MADISSIGQGSVGPLNRYDNTTATNDSLRHDRPGNRERPGRGGDSVELSDHARYLARLRDAADTSPARRKHIAEIREAIADGSYETDDRLRSAIDRLMRELDL